MTKQENKYSKWCLTVQKIRGVKTLPTVDEMSNMFSLIGASKWLFQLEIGEKKKEHYQCCFITKDRTRKSTLLKQMSELLNRKEAQFTLAKQSGSWQQNVDYCSKLDARLDNVIHSNFRLYDGQDIAVMNKGYRRPFQQTICEIVLTDDETSFKPADDRAIYWICDQTGCSGKSRLVKWFMYHFGDRVAVFSCNTDTQLRSAAIDAGPKDLVFVDISRATKSQINYRDKIANILATVEDIKNGMLASAFYGSYKTLIFGSPHIFIFSNDRCPVEMLTNDRWRQYVLTNQYQLQEVKLTPIVNTFPSIVIG